MTNELDEEWPGEDRPVPLQRRRRAPLVLAVVIGLAAAAAGTAYVWANMDGFVRSSGRETSESADPTSGDKAMLTDLLATQQKAGDDLESVKRSVADQQEQLKLIVDQLATLTSRVEGLQSAAAAPPPAPQQQLTIDHPPDVKPAVVAKPAKKPSHASKPAGPISVGGAPLSASPDSH